MGIGCSSCSSCSSTVFAYDLTAYGELVAHLNFDTFRITALTYGTVANAVLRCLQLPHTTPYVIYRVDLEFQSRRSKKLRTDVLRTGGYSCFKTDVVTTWNSFVLVTDSDDTPDVLCTWSRNS